MWIRADPADDADDALLRWDERAHQEHLGRVLLERPIGEGAVIRRVLGAEVGLCFPIERGIGMERFNLSIRADRHAFQEEAVQLAGEKKVPVTEAYRLLADRVDRGDKAPVSIDYQDRDTRAALAREARRRIQASRETSLRAFGDERGVVDFSRALASVIADMEQGKSVEGIDGGAA